MKRWRARAVFPYTSLVHYNKNRTVSLGPDAGFAKRGPSVDIEGKLADMAPK